MAVLRSAFPAGHRPWRVILLFVTIFLPSRHPCSLVVLPYYPICSSHLQPCGLPSFVAFFPVGTSQVFVTPSALRFSTVSCSLVVFSPVGSYPVGFSPIRLLQLCGLPLFPVTLWSSSMVSLLVLPPSCFGRCVLRGLSHSFAHLVRFQNLCSVSHFGCLTFSIRSGWFCQRAPSRLRIFCFYVCTVA